MRVKSVAKQGDVFNVDHSHPLHQRGNSEKTSKRHICVLLEFLINSVLFVLLLKTMEVSSAYLNAVQSIHQI